MISKVPVFTSTSDEETQSNSSFIQEVYGFLVDMASRPNFIMSLFGNVNSTSMMTHSLNGDVSPFHCLSELDASHDTDICLYPDSVKPIQPTTFDKDFTMEGDKVYANLSRSSGSNSPSSTPQCLPNMERQAMPLPNIITTFSRSRDNSLSSPTHCDSLSSRMTPPPISVTPGARKSWQNKHPVNWNSEDVLDWVFQVAKMYGIDGSIKSEAFQEYTGKDLLHMSPNDFMDLSREHYNDFHVHFNQLYLRSQFNGPETIQESPMLSATSEYFIENHSKSFFDYELDESSTGIDSTDSTTLITIDSYKYPVDLTDKFHEVAAHAHAFAQRQVEAPASDEGYSSAGSDHAHAIAPTGDLSPYPGGAQDQSYKSSQIPDLRPFIDDGTTTSSDDDMEEDDLPSVVNRPEEQRRRGRKPGQTTRGNHLWEFVRDLLKDTRYNPTLIKWENREMGVFRFVQSAAVAKMWGRRKNNQTMNYEKLSRAMRFCRDKKYFDNLPKGGKYPKKLCFRFGERAFGWQTDD